VNRKKRYNAVLMDLEMPGELANANHNFFLSPFTASAAHRRFGGCLWARDHLGRLYDNWRLIIS
jgi:hypothetical protein